MVRRSVDGDGGHAVFTGIIQIRFRVQPTVGRGERQVLEDLIGERHIHAIRASVVHVLIHASLYVAASVAEICGGNAGRNLSYRNIHQSYHVVQLVHVTADGSRELLSAVLHTRRVVVARLRIKVRVTDVEERAAAHHMQVAVMQLLDCRRLEALTPSQPEAKVAGREHGTYLGR